MTTAVTSVTRLLTGSGQPAAASPLEKRVSGPGLATPSPALPPVLVAGLAAIGVGVVGLMSVGGAAVSLMFNSLYLGFIFKGIIKLFCNEKNIKAYHYSWQLVCHYLRSSVAFDVVRWSTVDLLIYLKA